MIPLNFDDVHWHLLIVLNAKNDSKHKEVILFDSILDSFDIKNQIISKKPKCTESDRTTKVVNQFLHTLK